MSVPSFLVMGLAVIARIVRLRRCIVTVLRRRSIGGKIHGRLIGLGYRVRVAPVHGRRRRDVVFVLDRGLHRAHPASRGGELAIRVSLVHVAVLRLMGCVLHHLLVASAVPTQSQRLDVVRGILVRILRVAVGLW